jgi:hypothetical protein
MDDVGGGRDFGGDFSSDRRLIRVLGELHQCRRELHADVGLGSRPVLAFRLIGGNE